MRNIKLVLEYDGTNFGGFQRQKNARTVQEVLEEALSRLLGEGIRVHSAGRTDQGVHAEGQVVNFKTESALSLDKILNGANALLEEDLSARSVEAVPPEFHARFSAKSKVYRYRVYNGPSRRPLLRGYAHRVVRPLNVEEMRRGARALIGRHDFRSFQNAGSAVKSTVRQILQLDILLPSLEYLFSVLPPLCKGNSSTGSESRAKSRELRGVESAKFHPPSPRKGDRLESQPVPFSNEISFRQGDRHLRSLSPCLTPPYKGGGKQQTLNMYPPQGGGILSALNGYDGLIDFVIEADGFLYRMVRSLVGTLIQVGMGKLSLEDLKRILEGRDRRKAGPTLPPHGLTLVKVKYKLDTQKVF